MLEFITEGKNILDSIGGIAAASDVLEVYAQCVIDMYTETKLPKTNQTVQEAVRILCGIKAGGL